VSVHRHIDQPNPSPGHCQGYGRNIESLSASQPETLFFGSHIISPGINRFQPTFECR